jgi:hypothetical protein
MKEKVRYLAQGIIKIPAKDLPENLENMTKDEAWKWLLKWWENHQGTNQTPMLTYQQRRILQLIGLEEQIKLNTSPRHNIDLLSQILTIKFDLKHLALAQAQGKEIRI